MPTQVVDLEDRKFEQVGYVSSTGAVMEFTTTK